ncbi:hypothetical protein [Streptomyces sp. NRRL F-2664]|nr:hypothetical protein [Streptomyces sp. NRRL F-2664]
MTTPGPTRAVEGFADRVSVLPGESFGLYVSTTAPRFTVFGLGDQRYSH